MCGICGKLEFARDAASVRADAIRGMLEALAHRGPDDEGIYCSGRVGLGHKRLRIIDLATGRQPISNEDGTIWIVYNGEIYNYKELASSLVQKGHRFSTATDTEVIVHLYEELGEACVSRLRGMFSFALWDGKNDTLLLARDRVGIKPLYYCRTPRSLLFASEIKAILNDASVHPEIDLALIDRFLTYLYMPGRETLFKNIEKLEPGHYLTVKGGELRVKQYWDLTFRKVRRTFNQAREELECLLSRTVRDHMISDVPVGVLLSGGIDSSAVLSFAVENTNKPIKTFTVGFDGGCTDERPYARLAAQACGSPNYEITITSKQFWDCLPKYVWHMEEPVCEPPAIALYYIAKFAHEHVTVLLSGEGGDEAFAGYQKYRNLLWVEKVKRLLGPLSDPVGRLMPGLGQGNASSKYGKYGWLMRMPLSDYYYTHSATPFELFNKQYNHLYSAGFLDAVMKNSRGELSKHWFSCVEGLAPLDRMLYVDTKTWLPDDLLIKADKMTMANSLELRVPFLDHAVLEFAASLPAEYKLKHLSTKHILKRALSKRVPPEILYRKKTGFPVPYATWMTNGLRKEVAGILLDQSTLARGYFRRDAIERMIADAPHCSKELFSLVTLELWHRLFLAKQPRVY